MNERTEETFNLYLSKSNEIGYVAKIVNSILYVDGIPDVRINEIIMSDDGAYGLVTALTDDYVEILLLTENTVKVGNKITRTKRSLVLDVGSNMVGKTIYADKKLFDSVYASSKKKKYRKIDLIPTGISTRKKIGETLETGISIVDLIVPLGKGQRELLIGDRKTGKTEFIYQIMINQAKCNAIVIYALIGKSRINIKKAEEFVKNTKISENTIIVASGSSEPLGSIYLTPYIAMTIAEYFRDMGKDAVVILDDLSTHAKVYREISLISRKFPGREAYPGDIFFEHARLLERAGCFKKGTISCFPVAETVEGDITGYIQTNLMSITDGHLFFDSDLFKKGQRPSVNTFMSVTRVGRQTQTKLRWGLNRELTSFLTLLLKTENFVHFGSEINEGIKTTLETGKKLYAFLNQPMKIIIPLNLQIFFFCLVWVGAFPSSRRSVIGKYLLTAINKYDNEKSFRTIVDNLINKSDDFNTLLGIMSTKSNDYIKLMDQNI